MDMLTSKDRSFRAPSQDGASVIVDPHNFNPDRHCFRAAQTQGIVKGNINVLLKLPPHLQKASSKTQGKTHDAAARYANEAVFLQADQEPSPRGLGLRIFGVKGERLPSSDQEATMQDFFFDNGLVIESLPIHVSGHHAAKGEVH
ncbi:hypothetical protein SVAN01_01540 [Stagonosporopsis vannaccii]|nr:hypothetical protein SVAN01_01540 [Stagonosporopsis vannaccii]